MDLTDTAKLQREGLLQQSNEQIQKLEHTE